MCICMCVCVCMYVCMYVRTHLCLSLYVYFYIVYTARSNCLQSPPTALARAPEPCRSHRARASQPASQPRHSPSRKSRVQHWAGNPTHPVRGLASASGAGRLEIGHERSCPAPVSTRSAHLEYSRAPAQVGRAHRCSESSSPASSAAAATSAAASSSALAPPPPRRG
jgi:hypothetical protein